MQDKPYVLWLASWYPNKINPFEGDFIQRHAKAVSLIVPVTVFYISQVGPGTAGNEDSYSVHEDGELKEIVVFFKSPVTGLKLLDILLYNFYYRNTCRSVLKKYFREYGLPRHAHVHIPMKAGNAALWIKKKWRIPYLLTEHSTHYGMGSDDDFAGKSLFHRRRVRKIFFEAKTVINVSAVFGDKLKKLFNLTDIRVVNNTVDTRMFHFKPIPPGVFRFVHVSSLEDRHKNVTGILEAVKLLSTRRSGFEIVITGPGYQSFLQLVTLKGIDKFVIFTGEISYEEVSFQMRNSSAFVLFSWYENSPCVIGESLCCGLPVIASDTGGVSELVHASNGILVEPGNVAALSAAMEQMIDNYSNYDRQLIAANATEKFSFEEIGKEIADLYAD